MKRSSSVFRGVTGILAFSVAALSVAIPVAYENEGLINKALNVTTWELVDDGAQNVDSAYYKSKYYERYGDDITSKAAALKLERDVAAECVTQVEEGAVLLKNDNGALPLAHDALNNMLAAQGYTEADGMVDMYGKPTSGAAQKARLFKTLNAIDTTTYRYSDFTGAEITNLFDFADINSYDGIDFTYLTRNDWEGTFPAGYDDTVKGSTLDIAATPEMMKDIDVPAYEKPEDAPSAKDTFVWVDEEIPVDQALKFILLKDVNYESDFWDEFLNGLTLEQLGKFMRDSSGGTGAIDNIAMPSAPPSQIAPSKLLGRVERRGGCDRTGRKQRRRAHARTHAHGRKAHAVRQQSFDSDQRLDGEHPRRYHRALVEDCADRSRRRARDTHRGGARAVLCVRLGHQKG